MAAAYAWHPGSGGISHHWTVPLLPDEILSSWLVRAALTQGCDPLVLTGEVWPKWRIWTHDVDRKISEDRLEPLSTVSGIAPEFFRNAMLHPVATRIHDDQLPDKAIWPWMLTLGARNTKRRSGLQYCPICMAEDTKPHYRIQWRFAWHTACEKHGCSLLDRCPTCEAPVEPHRLMAEDQTVALCATCKADLRSASPGTCSENSLAFQRHADLVARHGHGVFLGQDTDAPKWFELASFFVSMIRRATRSRNETLHTFLHHLGVKLPGNFPLITAAGIELLRTHERKELFDSLYLLVATDQERFDLALKESCIPLQAFCGQVDTCPELLLEAITTLPTKPRVRAGKPLRKSTAPRSRHEVMRMMARLQRKLEMAKR